MASSLFGLAIGPDAAEYLDGLPPGKIRLQIVKKMRTLITQPYPPGCRKLIGVMDGEYPVWRIRSGDYRILYVVREIEVIVLDIGPRKEIYE